MEGRKASGRAFCHHHVWSTEGLKEHDMRFPSSLQAATVGSGCLSRRDSLVCARCYCGTIHEVYHGGGYAHRARYIKRVSMLITRRGFCADLGRTYKLA